MNNDLISRKWLTDAIRNRRTYLSYEDAKDVIELIDNAPTVPNEYMRGYEAAEREYKRPQGEWIVFYTPKKKKVFKCDKCMAVSIQGQTNYCYNCGADMRKGGLNNG